MPHSSLTPLADQFAALRRSCAQLPPAQALGLALLLRLLGMLESLARAWTSPAQPRRRHRSGKGPMVRDWMIPCHPTRKLRPSPPPPPQAPHARNVRAPPLAASAPGLRPPGLHPPAVGHAGKLAFRHPASRHLFPSM